MYSVEEQLKDLIQYAKKKQNGYYIPAYASKFNPEFMIKLLESWREMRESLNSIANADGPSSWGDVFAKEAGEAVAKADKVFE